MHHVLLPGACERRQQLCLLHHSGAQGWGRGAPPTPIPMPGGRPCCSGASGLGPGLGAWPVLLGRAMVGTLALLEGPELLDSPRLRPAIQPQPLAAGCQPRAHCALRAARAGHRGSGTVGE